jgi:hypothetical protein
MGSLLFSNHLEICVHSSQVPWNDRRRTWYVKCANEEEKTEWMRIFNNACNKAKPPVNSDVVLAQAFEGAYRAVRWNYGFYGWYSISGTEAETLGGLCCDILNRELINDVIYNIPAGPQRGTAVSIVRKTVDTAVVAAVSASWNSCVMACEGLRGTLETTVKGLLAPVFEQEVQLKEKVVSSISGTVNPFLADVGGRVCRPLLKIAANSITRAFCAAIKGYSHKMKDKIEHGECRLSVCVFCVSVCVISCLRCVICFYIYILFLCLTCVFFFSLTLFLSLRPVC